jgi:hypothetical protein
MTTEGVVDVGQTPKVAAQDVLATLKAEPGPQPPATVLDEAIPTTWIACDTCNQWRRIALSVANTMDDDAEWYVPESRPHREETRTAGRVGVGSLARRLHPVMSPTDISRMQ